MILLDYMSGAGAGFLPGRSPFFRANNIYYTHYRVVPKMGTLTLSIVFFRFCRYPFICTCRTGSVAIQQNYKPIKTFNIIGHFLYRDLA